MDIAERGELNGWCAIIRQHGHGELADYFSSKSLSRLIWWAQCQPAAAVTILNCLSETRQGDAFNPYIGRHIMGLSSILMKLQRCALHCGRQLLEKPEWEIWFDTLSHVFHLETPQHYRNYCASLVELPKRVKLTQEQLRSITEPFDTMTLEQHFRAAALMLYCYDRFGLYTLTNVVADTEAAKQWGLTEAGSIANVEEDPALHQYRLAWTLKPRKLKRGNYKHAKPPKPPGSPKRGRGRGRSPPPAAAAAAAAVQFKFGDPEKRLEKMMKHARIV